MATIQGVYVALFGRPADPAGLAFFNTATNNGANLTAIGDLAATAEYKARFEGKSNLQIIDAIYQSLFNRAPDAAGREFFANALNTGALNINNIAIAILDGAQGADKTTVDNKIAAANKFTAAIDTATEQAAYTGDAAAQAGRNFLTGVTSNAATVPSDAAASAAVQAIVDLPPGSDPTPGIGVTIALTVGADDLIGPTVANPAFRTTAANDTIVGGANWTTADKIDGGAGIDTLSATLGGAAVTPAAGGLANVENLVLNSSAAAAALNLTNATGVSSIAYEAGAAGAADAGLAITNIALGTALSVKGTVAAGGVVSFGFKGAGGSSDAATLTLDGANTSNDAGPPAVNGGVTVAGIENLSINVKAASTIELNAAQAKSIVVTGTGNTNLGTLETDLRSLDASGLNGRLTVTVAGTADTDGVTITGTKLNDTITLGAGKDVVVYNSSNISTQSLIDTINNFQGGNAAASGDKINVSAFNLTGAKAVTDFGGATIVDGASLAGNAIGFAGGKYYFDTNNNGQIDFATDLALTITLAGGSTFSATDNVIWA